MTDAPDLGPLAPFTPQRPVAWLSPRELARTGLRVATTSVFTRYADKREQFGHIPQPVFRRPLAEGRDDLWLDFVSDIGDGFHATYSVAHQIGRETLDVDGPGTSVTPLPRGEILVMGGDEVYPTASEEAYEARTTRLYEAAFPGARSEEGAPGASTPWLVAIPGNHDWYDGLTAFPRVFARAQWSPEAAWVGGWATPQTRSYAAVALPHRWWLLALDIQLDTYIDLPQLRYFTEAAREFAPGDGVILVTAKPCWYRLRGSVSPSYALLQYFVEKVVEPTGARVRLVLTGDAHHYARYEEVATGRQFVTAGNGGAYLSATHDLAEEVGVPPLEDRAGDPVTLRLAARFPDAAASAALVDQVRTAVRTLNPGLDRLFAGVYGTAAAAGAGGRPVAAAAVAAALAGGAVALEDPGDDVAEPERSARRRRSGLRHAARHLVAIGAVAGAGALGGRLVGHAAGGGARPTAAAVAAGLGALVGAAAGPRILGSHLASVGAAGGNLNEVLSAQAVEDYKGFLRIRVTADGLTIHPIGVHPVCRSWGPYDPDARPRIAPRSPVPARLIEPPVMVSRA